MSRYAFFDVDQTLYNGYSTSDFYVYLAKKGIKSDLILNEDRLIGEQYRAGAIDYTEASIRVVQLYANAVKGLSTNEVNNLEDEFLKLKPRFYSFVPQLMTLLNQYNFQTYLISAAASPCIEAIGRYLATDKYFASELAITNDIYQGKVMRMLNNQVKKEVIEQIIGPKTKAGLTLGFGDSTGDIEMLKAVDVPFVINPHQVEMRQLATDNNWAILDPKDVISHVKSIIMKIIKEV